jgi:hypothetical protein
LVVADLADEVEIEAAPGALTIGPSTHPRAGCAEAAAFDPDGLLDQMTSTRLDNEEWSWRQKKLSQGGDMQQVGISVLSHTLPIG